MDSMRRREAAQLGQSAPLGRVDGDLVGPVGADEHHLFVDEVAGEVLEQIPRHRVGPVQVLEPDDHCVVGGELGDQLEDGDEQPAVRRAVQFGDGRAGREPVLQRRQRRRVGQQIRLRPADLAEQIGERRQGNGVAADVRGPPEVQGDTGPRRALADDRRLADARVAADQHDRRQPVARVDDGALEHGQLRVPADEVRCRQAVVDDALSIAFGCGRPGQLPAPLGSEDLRGCGRCGPPPLRSIVASMHNATHDCSLAAASARCAALLRCGPPGAPISERSGGVDSLVRAEIAASTSTGSRRARCEPCSTVRRGRTSRTPPRHRGHFVAAQGLGRLSRFIPVAEREVDIRHVQHRERTDAIRRGQRLPAASCPSARAVSPRRAASIAFARASRSRPTGSVSARVGGGGRRRPGPAAEADERFRRERVEVAPEAVVEAGELSFRNRVERGVERGLVVAGVAEATHR